MLAAGIFDDQVTMAAAALVAYIAVRVAWEQALKRRAKRRQKRRSADISLPPDWRERKGGIFNPPRK